MSHRSQQNTTLNDFLENLLRSSQSKSTFTRLEEDETVIRITTTPPPQWWCTQDISYASFTTHLHLQERKIEQKMYIAYFVPMSDKLTRKLMWKLSCLEELEYFINLSIWSRYVWLLKCFQNCLSMYAFNTQRDKNLKLWQLEFDLKTILFLFPAHAWMGKMFIVLCLPALSRGLWWLGMVYPQELPDEQRS